VVIFSITCKVKPLAGYIRGQDIGRETLDQLVRVIFNTRPFSILYLYISRTLLAATIRQRFLKMPLLSWVTGWINTSGWIALVASGGFLGSQLIVGIISLMNASYVAQRWHQFLIYIGYNLVAFLINAFMTGALPIITRVTNLFLCSIPQTSYFTEWENETCSRLIPGSVPTKETGC
jgi:hypothetical protein